MGFLKKQLGFAFTLYSILSLASGSKILIHALLGKGSLFSITASIARELYKRGHNITLLMDDTYSDEIQANKQLRFMKFEIYRSNFSSAEIDDILSNMTNAGMKGEYTSFLTIFVKNPNFRERRLSECHNLLGDVGFISKLRNASFDLTITSGVSLCPIIQYLGRPYVVVSPIFTSGSWPATGIRSPFMPSYMPEVTSGYDHRMTFTERLKNMIYSFSFQRTIAGVHGSYEDLKQQHDLPDASLAYADAEMWLLNTHFALDFPRPLLPNMVAVGGLTTKPEQPLDSEWVEFLHSAGHHGVVLFSMGTYIQGIDEDIADMFARAFAQLPQKIIWKLNGKPSENLPPNVKVADWIPQNDLLGQPQVKVFVSHCGLNGVWEAVYHGVPMVAIPVFSDQFDNAQRVVSRGMGLKLDIATLTSDELANAIRTVIEDPRYKNTTSHLSAIFRDTPKTPIEQAGDWIEYVIRHGGAKHLRSAALDLNIFQYLLLDVISVVLAAFVTFVIIGVCCCRLCVKCCRNICRNYEKLKNE